MLGLATALTGGAAFACSEVLPPDPSGTFYGPVTAVAGGTGRAYVIIDRSGSPTDLGVAFTETVMASLPTASTEFVFDLPPEAAMTSFKHAALNWQHAGHPPAGIYTVPHFDVHFYMITLAERLAIVPGTPTIDAKLALRPAADFVPAGYAAGMAAAQMGLHWNDPEAPERKGEPFTKTFLYGSYDGNITFAEPMVTVAYLAGKPAEVSTPVKLPARFATRGYHATSYTAGFNASTKEYRMSLSGLALHQAAS
jgi:hypothetical protein